MVASSVAPLTTAIDALLAIDTDLLDDTDIHELVVELGRQSARLEAAYCRVINRWDRRQSWADKRLEITGRPFGPGNPDAPVRRLASGPSRPGARSNASRDKSVYGGGDQRCPC